MCDNDNEVNGGISSYLQTDETENESESKIARFGGNLVRSWRNGNRDDLIAEAALIAVLIVCLVFMFVSGSLPTLLVLALVAVSGFYIYKNYEVWIEKVGAATAAPS